MTRRRWAVAVTLACVVVFGGPITATPGTAAPATASATTNPLANPQGNRPYPALSVGIGTCTSAPGSNTVSHCSSPCYPRGVFGYNGSTACTDVLLKAINEAQTAEHLPGFTLPSDFVELPPTRQLFVLVNLERISRGIPPLVGLSPYLSAEATTAAVQGVDPSFQTAYGPVRVWAPPDGGDYAFGGAWSGDSVDAASALFGWFYDDGWGGPSDTANGACTSPTASLCWGHRDELLGEWAGTACTDCIAGAGYASPAHGGWKESYDFLLVRPQQFPTPLVFTWDADVVPYLPAGWEGVRAP